MNDLRTLLRQHDPAHGAALAPEDRHRIRAAMLDARPLPLRIWRPVAATVMSLIVLFTVAFGLIRRREEPPQSRRVEYTTPGGTRVIWTLDPSFRM
jgi:hypothetical protein